MNIYYPDILSTENTENLVLLAKEIDKIFHTSKIKKYDISKYNFPKKKFFIFQDPKKIICKEINLNYYKAHANPNVPPKAYINSFGTKNIKTDEKHINSPINNKNNRSKNKSCTKNSFAKKINTLIRPIIVEDENKIEKEHKNSKLPLNKANPFQINVKNDFNINSDINSFNNNFKIPFVFNLSSKNLLFNFDFGKFPFNEHFYKGKNNNFPFNSNNTNINNFFGINNNNLIKNDKINISFANSLSSETSLDKKKFILLEGGIKKKGRKSKKLNNINIQSKHTKFSSDNMMRKLKNKIIESSRQLTNKILSEEILNMKSMFQFPYTEFKKIKGSFSQELNIKFNLWFYQIKISDIFSMEVSTKYSTFERSSNKELIEYIFSRENIQNFAKTKLLLNMPFHQYYHDIFLAEKKSWLKYFDIKPEENKYELNNLLISLEEDDKDSNLNKIYVEKMKKLADDYEGFFLYKKMRNVDKKNNFIKSFMDKTFNNNYSFYSEQVKKLKDYYNNRKNNLNENTMGICLINNFENIDNNIIIKKNFEENDEKITNEENLLINTGNEENKYLNRKRNSGKIFISN